MIPQNINYYIAETAFHHEGNFNFLNSLIDDLSNLDINAIKFHLLLELEDYMIATHPAIEVLEKISLSVDNWEKIFDKVSFLNKDIIALTNDIKSLEFINSVQEKYPISAIELHSTGLNDIFLLKECLNFKNTVILGIGGSSFDEVQFAVDFLKHNGKNNILLMHGFQNYPTNYSDINFSRISLMHKAFGLPVGYADHTDPNDSLNSLISVFPISLGVNVFEKHVTNVFGEKRIDSQAAISLDQMKDVINLGNTLKDTLGDSAFKFSQAESNYGDTGPMKKALVARNDLKEGEVLTIENIAYKRTEVSSALQQKDIFRIVGSVLTKDVKKDELLGFDKLRYSFKSSNFDQFFVNIK